ncbi:hypothetical protein [Planctobacterium marinum]|uniref:hypothetical protein n=1 Tax=Planctobacterium marinum TaxID=1631968 RepID=UPI001E623278|nr:hypothetical protein [Planctobacterium marinum]MCC2604899.1 hypothetical protein [Planctobacterium marinum]
MSKGPQGDASHTRLLKDLLKRIYSVSPVKDSLFEIAADYFSQAPENEKRLAFAKSQIDDVDESIDMTSDAEKLKKLNARKDTLEINYKAIERELEEKRLARLEKVIKITTDLMSTLQGKSLEDFNSNVARALGTLQLLSPTQGRDVAKQNQKTKHLYKAILSVRLVHHLLHEEKIKDEYLCAKFQENIDYMAEADEQSEETSPYRTDVEIPLIIACLCQDIGQVHPDADLILRGEDGDLDEFRMLEKEERNNLLKINYTQSLKFVTQGLGMQKYAGNSKEERAAFNDNEKRKLLFIRNLLKGAINPGDGIGNLLKVPQVYCSVVLSTKDNYSYESLPRVNAVMERGAELGAYNKAVSDALIEMLGIFPQGFGIAYIPKDSDGFDLDRYEYAVVNSLFPKQSDVPICRVATRGLQFNAFALNHVIGKTNNLFYPATRKKLEKVSKAKLIEILRELKSDFNEGEDSDLIPRCWHPQDFFSFTRTQNLWNKVNSIKN